MKARTRISAASANRGFTLLELLLVCALVLLAAGLVGSFLAGSEQKEFTTNLRQISAELKSARRLAIVTGAEQKVRLATESPEPPGPPERGAPDAPPPEPPDWINQSMRLRYAVSVDDSLEEMASLEVTFFPIGSSTGGLIELTGIDREAYLYVFPLTGRLLVEPSLADIEDAIEEARP